MIIAIDIGNTRVKWGLYAENRWHSTGFMMTAEAEKKLIAQAEKWPANAHVVICNVAGKALEEVINPVFSARFRQCFWLRAQASTAGLINSYEEPQKLGADRWAAMIGARSKEKGATLVVCAGTATTVDWLDARGVFRGGLIMPGFDMMRMALAANTARLPFAEGVLSDEPRNTHDAIFSGCLYAQVGAIERMYVNLCKEGEAHCLLTGGIAPLLAPCLTIPYRIEENLILTGLVQFCQSTSLTENLSC